MASKGKGNAGVGRKAGKNMQSGGGSKDASGRNSGGMGGARGSSGTHTNPFRNAGGGRTVGGSAPSSRDVVAKPTTGSPASPHVVATKNKARY